jgi:hypothetical protein
MDVQTGLKLLIINSLQSLINIHSFTYNKTYLRVTLK